MTDPTFEFIEAMRVFGIAPSKQGIVTDGKIHRYHVAGDRVGKKNGWYVFFSGDIPAGAFGSWKTGDHATWCAKSDHELNEDERQENRRKMDEARLAREKAETVIRQAACDKANTLWSRAVDSVSADHPYVVAKGIRPAGARQMRDMLVLPLHDIDGHLHSLQFIGKDGSKRFLTGGRKAGCFTVLEGDESGDIFYVTEGWATGCSILQATGKTTAVCFDAGNLAPVCKSLREKHPDSKIIVCADDDYQTDGNPGVTKAAQAAEAIGALVVIPQFGDDRPDGATDFNDMHHLYGLDALRDCLRKSKSSVANFPKKRAGEETAKRPESQDHKNKKKDIDWNKLDSIINRYVLIYGTDTCYDIADRLIMKVSALRLAIPDYVNLWLKSPVRKTVRQDQIVFDPTLSCKKTDFNLYSGFEMKPKPGNFAPILELLNHLCADSAESDAGVYEVMDWVLKWLALPLQRPGAKMRSALVFHGSQGTGKNLFFEVIAAVYGRYALVVGQAELEEKYNDWMSQKLFLIGDEVIAKQELYDHKNKLKTFITGITVHIHGKFLPLRSEKNHINVVFLSNEEQPLALEPSDRRYFVVYTPPQRHDGLYKEVAECLKNGGIEAFYHHLLNLDLGDFNEFTKPVMTSAKRDLIQLGLKPAQRFAYEWISGQIPLPLGGCSVEQLYQAFKHWVERNGERWTPNKANFGSQVLKATEILNSDKDEEPVLRKQKVRLPFSKDGQTTLWMWIPRKFGPVGEETLGQWAIDAIRAFEVALEKFKSKEAGVG